MNCEIHGNEPRSGCDDCFESMEARVKELEEELKLEKSTRLNIVSMLEESQAKVKELKEEVKLLKNEVV